MTYRVCYLVEIQFITDEKPPKRSTLPTQKVNTSHPKGQHYPPKRSTLSTQKVNTLIGNPAVNLGFSDGIRPKCQVFPMRSLYEPDRWMNHPKGQQPEKRLESRISRSTQKVNIRKNGLKALFPSTQKVNISKMVVKVRPFNSQKVNVRQKT